MGLADWCYGMILDCDITGKSLIQTNWTKAKNYGRWVTDESEIMSKVFYSEEYDFVAHLNPELKDA